jgi:hypothetical protein
MTISSNISSISKICGSLFQSIANIRIRFVDSSLQASRLAWEKAAAGCRTPCFLFPNHSYPIPNPSSFSLLTRHFFQTRDLFFPNLKYPIPNPSFFPLPILGSPQERIRCGFAADGGFRAVTRKNARVRRQHQQVPGDAVE